MFNSIYHHHHVACSMYHLSCIMYHVSCTMMYMYMYLLQFFSHLISSSSFTPLPLPTSRLPSPSPFAWLKQTSDLPLCLHQWTMDAWLWSFVFLCIFSTMTYVQWFEVISISRIGLLDKLERVSCPILLALCWSTPRIYDMWFCCCYMLSSCSLCQ